MAMSDKVLFIYTHLSSFVKSDISILETRCKVNRYQFINTPKQILPLSLIRQFFFLLINIKKYKYIYIWFADYHSFLPILLSSLTGKKSFLVIGGYDVCREKPYKYGSLSKPLRAFMTLRSIKMASHVLCVSRNIERTIQAIAPVANTSLIYNGVHLSTLKESYTTTPTPANNTQQAPSNSSDEPNSNTVLCVALVNTLQSFFIKGIDRYNTIAEKLPKTSFIIVGCQKKIFDLAGITPAANLIIIPPVPQHELYSLYSRSHVYCQPSRRESFSLSLAEAMSHKMIPVISTAGGMPEVVAELGHTVYMSDSPLLRNQGINNAVNAIKKALTQEKSNIYSNRISNNFSIQIREQALSAKFTRRHSD